MSKLFVAGNRGMVGSAICRLNKEYELILADKGELDLRDQSAVNNFIKDTKPDKIIICAAKVGGIYANNKYPAEFIYDNLMIQSNIINSAYKNGIDKLLFLGSSCIYPRLAEQPIKEEYLLSSKLEPTNESYAIAKIAGLRMCDSYSKQYGVDYHGLMPSNLYGLGDNYNPETSHVIPSMIRKLHNAKVNGLDEFKIYGSGTPKREFLFVDDLADVCFKFLNLKNPPAFVNVGCDQELTILELAKKVAKVVGYTGEISPSFEGLDGTPRRKLDNSLLKSLIEFNETSLDVGLPISYEEFLGKNL